jgi:hypothetical protein
VDEVPEAKEQEERDMRESLNNNNEKINDKELAFRTL